jgi:DNA mismatch repair ATPase MutS
MVEMNETASFCKQEFSFVDEIGRGTSTYDGFHCLGIAEFYTRIKPKPLATHYP